MRGSVREWVGGWVGVADRNLLHPSLCGAGGDMEADIWNANTHTHTHTRAHTHAHTHAHQLQHTFTHRLLQEYFADEDRVEYLSQLLL